MHMHCLGWGFVFSVETSRVVNNSMRIVGFMLVWVTFEVGRSLSSNQCEHILAVLVC